MVVWILPSVVETTCEYVLAGAVDMVSFFSICQTDYMSDGKHAMQDKRGDFRVLQYLPP